MKCWGASGNQKEYGFTHGVLGQGHKKTLGDEPGEMGNNLPSIDLGTTTGNDLGEPLTAKAIASGVYHTCALLSHGRVKCWGYNLNGQLGQGHKRTLGDEPGEMGNNLPSIDLGTTTGDNLGEPLTAKAIACGESHTCVLLDNDRIKCWGMNDFHQLGDNLNALNRRGDASGEMGNSLPFSLLGNHSGQALTIKAIDLGYNHTCSIFKTESVMGRVKCWGANYHAQLGQGSSTVLTIRSPSALGDDLPFTSLGTGLTAKAITTYGGKVNISEQGHTCVILNNDRVKCWGGNSSGQLGQGIQEPWVMPLKKWEIIFQPLTWAQTRAMTLEEVWLQRESAQETITPV